MLELLNTLYVTVEGAYLHLDHDTVRVEVERQTQLRVPLLHLGGLVCFGNILISPALLHRCAEDGRSVALFDRNGRFKARVEGPTSGNVLLRRAQHLALSDGARTAAIARNVVASKVQNARHVLQRAAREANKTEDGEALAAAVTTLAGVLSRLGESSDVNQMRGYEGDAARTYFGVFTHMVRADRKAFQLDGRRRRPPLGRMNALLSFLYALLLVDCVAAVEGVGLDPQVGYLHTLRPGRPALGLDVMEELRAVLVDRLVLSLVNRGQLRRDDFEEQPGGAVRLTDQARKAVVVAYQKRKQEEVHHRVMDRKIPFGLVPHVQARLLARYLRGDVEHYLPYVHR